MRWLAFERRWADAVLRAVVPPSTDGRFRGAAAADMDAFWSTFGGSAPASLRWTVRLATWMVALAPWWLLVAPRTLVAMRDDERDAVVVRLAASDVFVIRQCVAVLKLCGTFAAFTEAGNRSLFSGAA